MEKVIVKLSEPTSQYQQKIFLDAGYEWSVYQNKNAVKGARFLYVDVENKEMTWSFYNHIHSSINFEEFDKKYLNHKYVETKAGNVEIVSNKPIADYEIGEISKGIKKNIKSLDERLRENKNILEERKQLDKINPSHYKQYSRETIDTMQGTSTPEEFKGYLKLNIIKYISRYQSKNGVEDLKKAQWYLNKLTEVVDNEK